MVTTQIKAKGVATATPNQKAIKLTDPPKTPSNKVIKIKLLKSQNPNVPFLSAIPKTRCTILREV